MKRRTYTMQDVARLAGVSVSTVSAVVNKRGIVSPRLTAKVFQAIEAIGFFPHQVARSLRTGRTCIIGMVVTDAANPFFVEVMRGVEDEALKNGYEVMVCNSNDRLDLQLRHLNALQAQRVDGILLAPSDSFAVREHLVRIRLPIVFVDCVPVNAEVDCVVTDNFDASSQAVSHLISLGHQKIAVISGGPIHSTSIERANGYRKAMQAANLPILEKYVQQGDSHIESGYQIGRCLLEQPEPPTAIFSLNNRMTLGILRAMRELGISCPERVSVVSFDDPDWAVVFNPSLTTVAQPTFEIGKRAVQLLLETLRSKETETQVKPTKIVLKSSLRIRRSTGPAPKPVIHP